ncbi:TolC family protein [Bdellovibrio sp. HCB337]|uniref:TolC family protein n=1 Tax=Bdellovibrio sp. HCB337 TaxID=3394358 RepID=UPI0039A4DBAE
MSRKMIGVFAVALCLFQESAFAESEKINSETLRSLLETKNAKVQAAQKGKEAAEEKEGYLTRSFLPSLEMYVGQETFKPGRQDTVTEPAYGAELRVNLFNGGRDQLENRVRELGTEKKGFEVQRVLSEELEKARTEYWHSLYYREKISLLQSTIEVNKQNLSSADRRIRSGVATESDRVEFEMQAIELAQELSESKMKQESHLRNLKVLLGVAKLNVGSLSEKLDHEHEYEGELKHSMKDHEFLVKENEILAEQNRLLAKKEKREWWPKLEAFAAYNQYNERDKEFADAQDRTESVVGLRVNLSASAGLESRREGAALQKEAEGASAIAVFQKTEIEAHLENEMAELSLMHSQIHDAEENIKRAEKYYRLTQSEYGRGVKNSPDVLGASEKLFETRHKRLEIVRDFQLAKAHVLSKIGK